MKKIIAGAIAGAAILASVVPAFAHGGGIVDPSDPNCMGQLARLHANGKDPGANPDTQKGFGTDQPHGGLGGSYDSIQDQAKAFQEFCNQE